MSSPDFATGDHDGGYDLVFSGVLAEHVRDAAHYHFTTYAGYTLRAV